LVRFTAATGFGAAAGAATGAGAAVFFFVAVARGAAPADVFVFFIGWFSFSGLLQTGGCSVSHPAARAQKTPDGR
jgi:hypothetical protein